MKKNFDQIRALILLGIIIAVAFAGLAVFYFLSHRVEMNPAGTVGNTAGNLNNSGLFCEYNGKVYFSNAKDNGSLYVMNPDESEMKKLNTSKVRNLLAGGKYLYYFQLGSSDTSGFGAVNNTHSLNRCDLKGKNTADITRDIVVTGQLVDNYLYLLTSEKEHPVFYKIKIDKSGKVHLADYQINPACASGGFIYYNNTLENHSLYALNTANDSPRIVLEGNLWYPTIYDDHIYYLDVEGNYRLCRYSLSSQSVEILTNDRIDCFNVGSGYIYYQKNSAASPQLKCMHTDGSNVIVLAEGNYTNINMTSQYVYFQAFGSDGSMYHARLGSNAYGEF